MSRKSRLSSVHRPQSAIRLLLALCRGVRVAVDRHVLRYRSTCLLARSNVKKRLNPSNCSDGNSRSFFPQFPTPLCAAFSPRQEGLEAACCGSGTWKRRHTKLMVRGAPTPSMLAHRRARRHHLNRGNVDRVRGNGALQLLPALDLHLDRPPCSGPSAMRVAAVGVSKPAVDEWLPCWRVFGWPPVDLANFRASSSGRPSG